MMAHLQSYLNPLSPQKKKKKKKKNQKKIKKKKKKKNQSRTPAEKAFWIRALPPIIEIVKFGKSQVKINTIFER